MTENSLLKTGFHFSCTGCAGCCSGFEGYVWVTIEEVEKIAHYLNQTVENFSKRYLKKVGNRLSLKEGFFPDYNCVFLDEKKCSIYPVRPLQCKTYPFWPQLLENAALWEEEKRRCEGIGQGPFYGPEEIEKIFSQP